MYMYMYLTLLEISFFSKLEWESIIFLKVWMIKLKKDYFIKWCVLVKKHSFSFDLRISNLRFNCNKIIEKKLHSVYFLFHSLECYSKVQIVSLCLFLYAWHASVIVSLCPCLWFFCGKQHSSWGLPPIIFPDNGSRTTVNFVCFFLFLYLLHG